MEREADYLNPCSDEIKNLLSFTSTPPHVFNASCFSTWGTLTLMAIASESFEGDVWNFQQRLTRNLPTNSV